MISSPACARAVREPERSLMHVDCLQILWNKYILWDKIKWIGHLKSAFSMPSGKVANLVSNVCNYRVAFGFDLDPLRRFEGLHSGQVVPIWSRSKLRPSGKSCVVEFQHGLA